MINLPQEELDSYYAQIMSSFEPVKEFELSDYYGVAIMSVKKNDHIQLRLQYDYGSSNPVNSKALEVDDLDQAILIYSVLMTKRKPRTSFTKFKLKPIKKEVKDENESKTPMF